MVDKVALQVNTRTERYSCRQTVLGEQANCVTERINNCYISAREKRLASNAIAVISIEVASIAKILFVTSIATLLHKPCI